jgi:hypothetical protein
MMKDLAPNVCEMDLKARVLTFPGRNEHQVESEHKHLLFQVNPSTCDGKTLFQQNLFHLETVQEKVLPAPPLSTSLTWDEEYLLAENPFPFLWDRWPVLPPLSLSSLVSDHLLALHSVVWEEKG